MRADRLEWVKWLAFAAMVVDHVDLILLGRSQPWMYQIGRFAMPAFAIAFAVGLARSTQPGQVARRLAWPAIAAQFAWAVASPVEHANILATFGVCALVVDAGRRRLAFGLVAAAAALGISPWLEGGPWLVLLVMAIVAGELTRWRWIHAVGIAPWVLGSLSPGLVVGVAAPYAAQLLPRDLPRRPGLLAWLYAAHLAVLAAVRPFV